MFLPKILGLNLWRIKKLTVPHGFIEIVNIFKHKPNKLWADQGEIYDNFIQKWLEENNILMYSYLLSGL